MIDQTEEANSKKELQVELRSGLLPSMRDQLINLRQIIDLESDFSQQDPTSRYQLVCGIQSGIVVTYNQIKSALFTICPASAKFTKITRLVTDDQDLEELKFYRLHGIACHVGDDFLATTSPILHFLEKSYQFIYRLKRTGETPDDELYISDDHLYFSEDELYFARKNVIRSIYSALAGIESAIEWLRGSELDMIQDEWTLQIDTLDTFGGLVRAILFRIGPPAHYILSKPLQFRPLIKPVAHLARSLITITKLSRLFFNKLSTQGMNRKRFTACTRMSSHQLTDLEELVLIIPETLGDCLRHLEDCRREIDMEVHKHDLIRAASKTKTLFESNLNLVLIHLVPIIPDTEADDFPVRNYYKTWLEDWKGLLDLAIQHLIDGAESLGNNTT
ncbi:hypothetical protein MJO28_002689 [Puccinia striiformis f. sp. tritici]|uniref:Uncharacterized protein n=1 Tax=Puccinia striiformis f. sp. tritici TaxID=168172 RepID=A0ACC0ER15_9BASI|nr:hypothetical protein Pst134EA_005341 [Puccinia striiformis f. sp. tritici]KAH9471441.1 hypothetical protein Pst134EA_005341 [Puccinia striiformis f. sp. tritici]KAI7958898.1 hypothetical protein MJO28_002689 [Puccinia striiformis f. sp. tritici]KAI9628886.1 hypothetical protein KEM48_011280 [Puccinia striiformis f. sp. tritici PST-130]